MSTQPNSESPSAESGPIQRYSIALEATVNTASWTMTYGQTPGNSLADTIAIYLAADAREALRLRVLRGAGQVAEVGLSGWENATGTDPTWTRVRIVVTVTLNVTFWCRRWGISPDHGLGPHLAAELSGSRPMVEEVDGTVIYLPQSSGRMVSGDTYFTGSQTR